MSQFSTYQKYSLANQLVQLEEAWKGLSNNQIYQTGQATLWKYKSEKIRLGNAGDNPWQTPLDYRITAYFEQPTYLVITRVWMYVNGNGPYKYEPLGQYLPSSYSAEELDFSTTNLSPTSGQQQWIGDFYPAFFSESSSPTLAYTWDMELEIISSSLVRNFTVDVVQTN